VPTTRPRYTVTDTGELREMLDLAEQAWPEVGDRKELLMRLAACGHEIVASRVAAGHADARRERQREALRRAGELVDAELLLSDAAWQ
jgi:hypothetical protein